MSNQPYPPRTTPYWFEYPLFALIVIICLRGLLV